MSDWEIRLGVTDRLESLLSLGGRVAAAQSERDVLDVIVEDGARLAGASAAVVGLVEEDLVRVAAAAGYPSGYLDSWQTFSLQPGTPMSDVIRSERAVYCSSREERDENWPAFRGTGASGSDAFVVLPLAAARGVVGAVTLSYREQKVFAREERLFLETFAGFCGLALERTRASAAEQRLARRSAFLAEASKALSRSLDYEETLLEVGRMVVPELADWFACDLLSVGGVELVAVSHVDPVKVEWARELRRHAPVRMDSTTGMPNVLRTGQAELYEVVTDEMIEAAAATSEELLLTRQVGLSSVIIVPLIARNQTLGALTLVWAESSRYYDSEDLALAEELADRAAVAIDNARLYQAQAEAHASEQRAHGRTLRLQRFTERLAPALTVDDVAEIAINKALVASGGLTSLLALETRDRRHLEIRHVEGQPAPKPGTIKLFSRDDPSVVGEVFRSREPLWLGTREEWERFEEAIGRPDALRSVAVLPVATSAQFFGVLGIAFGQEREFPADERAFLLAIAGQTAQALDRARLYEEQSEIAHVLQQSLLPQTLPPIPGCELGVSYRAAGRANETGGDFYDLFPVEGGHMLVIGDVCGKGPRAAALTSLCRYTLRTAALQVEMAQPAALLAVLNRAILGQSSSETEFASVICLLLRPNNGGLSALMTTAGHPPPLIRRANGLVETCSAPSPIVGAFEDAEFSETTLLLAPGDLMVLHTDGLTDARLITGQRIGEERIHELLTSLIEPSPLAAISALESLLIASEITDDVAIVALTPAGPPSLAFPAGRR